ncbi:hypothetical protein CRENBAI_022426 [Crenichthys baileyi]|uniref:G-protein coupled receptors family 2 profile 1 domain-containing protein n=1 Tax=Crenichthys baileyi TaxID=28760 RepID=A0AAV9S630_9TELE
MSRAFRISGPVLGTPGGLLLGSFLTTSVTSATVMESHSPTSSSKEDIVTGLRRPQSAPPTAQQCLQSGVPSPKVYTVWEVCAPSRCEGVWREWAILRVQIVECRASKIYLCVEDMRFAGSLWTVWSLLMLKEAAGAETISETSLSPGLSTVTGQSEKALSQGQYRCVEPSRRDAQENRTGLFCSPMWDGIMCWNKTPAGESVTQKCPDHPDLGATEKVTKYCDKSGNWVQTGSTCQPALKGKKEIHFLEDVAGEPTMGAIWVRTEKSILENENKCLEKMKNDPPYNKSGLHCSRNWDGWLCWDDTPAGNYASQNCPDYFVNFDRTEKATKYCGADGHWFHHPESNKMWTNYTLCLTTDEKKLGVMSIYKRCTDH